MSKATPQNVIDLSFVKETFNLKAEADFNLFIQNILDEEAVEVEAEIGASLYNSTTEPTKTRVVTAEKYRTAAVLIERGTNKRLRESGNSEKKLSTYPEAKQRNYYLRKAETAIDSILGRTSASAFGVEINSHFEADQPT